MTQEEIKLKTELASTKKYLDIVDVSLLSNYSIPTIRRRVASQTLKPFKSGNKKKLVFLRSLVEKWIENGAQ